MLWFHFFTLWQLFPWLQIVYIFCLQTAEMCTDSLSEWPWVLSLLYHVHEFQLAGTLNTGRTFVINWKVQGRKRLWPILRCRVTPKFASRDWKRKQKISANIFWALISLSVKLLALVVKSSNGRCSSICLNSFKIRNTKSEDKLRLTEKSNWTAYFSKTCGEIWLI